MALGPVCCAGALALLSRVDAHPGYLRDVLPGVVLLGLGLSLTVTPLTATALGSVAERHVGVASGVNNAVARAAGLLAVAVLPLAAGIGAGSLTDPADLAPVYRRAMLLCAGLLLAGAAVAAVTVPNQLPERTAPAPDLPPGAAVRPGVPAPGRATVRVHCAITGPPPGAVHPPTFGPCPPADPAEG
jgi:hypothetical protein